MSGVICILLTHMEKKTGEGEGHFSTEVIHFSINLNTLAGSWISDRGNIYLYFSEVYL